jgi:hypothetical protein
MAKKRYEKGIEKKNEILDTAYNLSLREGGWLIITRSEIAENLGCADSLINKYFQTIEELKNEIMKLAIIRENLHILRQGVVFNNKVARNAPKSLLAKL